MYVYKDLPPMAPVPVPSAVAMVPMTPLPITAFPPVAPAAFMPDVGSARPGPVAVDPDIITTGRGRPYIINIGRLVGHISFHLAAGGGQKANYCYDHE